jgi:hypothetical protein
LLLLSPPVVCVFWVYFVFQKSIMMVILLLFSTRPVMQVGHSKTKE